jgi:CheY-like chemotaxis protein
MSNNGLSVLIVDDNQSILDVVKELLADLKKFKLIICSNNGSDALTKMSNQEFGLVILDLSMPKLGGLEVLQAMNLKGLLKKTHVLISSGTLDGDKIKEAVALGVKNIIVKPFTNDDLIAKIEGILKNS